MTSGNSTSRAADLVARLRRGCAAARNALLPGARELPKLHGVTPPGHFFRPAENVLAEARQLLVDSGKVFSFGNSVVVVVDRGDDKRLVYVWTDQIAEAYAQAVLANIFLCELPSNEEGGATLEFAPPANFVSLLLNGFQLFDALPKILGYFRRPVFDAQFRLLGAGWHVESGTLVYGIDVEPVIPTEVLREGRAIDRLPTTLRRLLLDFCFRSDADLVNYIALLITGILANLLVAAGKAVGLIDGNQPGLGKTLLARVAGIILDGEDPHLIEYTPNDEELTKRICSHIRSGQSSVIAIDNAKTAKGAVINSPVIEAQSMAPTVSLRILGQSANYSTPNLVVWFITMNDTKASTDLISRGVPVRLHLEGEPERRQFANPELIDFARDHRADLLGELFGMVVQWTNAGRPCGRHQHRCSYWAQVVGGILQANGLSEFLQNRAEAAAEFDVARDQLSLLAEAVVSLGGPFIVVPENNTGETVAVPDNTTIGRPASEWARYFTLARIGQDRLELATSQAAMSTKCGKFLSRNLDHRVPVESNGRRGNAELCRATGRSRSNIYFFRVCWGPAEPESGVQQGGGLCGAAGETSLTTAAVSPATVANSSPVSPPPAPCNVSIGQSGGVQNGVTAGGDAGVRSGGDPGGGNAIDW